MYACCCRFCCFSIKSKIKERRLYEFWLNYGPGVNVTLSKRTMLRFRQRLTKHGHKVEYHSRHNISTKMQKVIILLLAVLNSTKTKNLFCIRLHKQQQGSAAEIRQQQAIDRFQGLFFVKVF